MTHSVFTSHTRSVPHDQCTEQGHGPRECVIRIKNSISLLKRLQGARPWSSSSSSIDGGSRLFEKVIPQRWQQRCCLMMRRSSRTASKSRTDSWREGSCPSNQENHRAKLHRHVHCQDMQGSYRVLTKIGNLEKMSGLVFSVDFPFPVFTHQSGERLEMRSVPNEVHHWFLLLYCLRTLSCEQWTRRTQ